MPRAKRFFLPGYICHITHRCHDKNYLLKYQYDKQRYLHWLMHCVKKYSLKVLGYCITDNHIHLLINPENSRHVIAQSMHITAGCTAQEYNKRKKRKGAFWEDRYHATAIQSNTHLIICLLYIDLNMVRAHVVSTPSQWEYGGYYELFKSNQNGIIDRKCLLKSTGLTDWEEYKRYYTNQMEIALQGSLLKKDESWSKSIAIGDEQFINVIKQKLGIKVKKRPVLNSDISETTTILKEPLNTYGAEYSHIDQDNSYCWHTDSL